MQDPTEDKIRILSDALTSEQLNGFMRVFPEFDNVGDSPKFRRAVAFVYLFAQKMIEKDASLPYKVTELKSLCIQLLGENISGVNSELLKWLEGAGGGKKKKGSDPWDIFLRSFQRFLENKLKDILSPQVNLVDSKDIPNFKPISFSDFKLFFPELCKKIEVEEYAEEINELIRLINIFNAIPDKMAVRYKSRWIVIQIALLVEAILPEEESGNDNITLLSGVRSPCNDQLNAVQQALLFKVSRTISADFFCLLYNDEMRIFLEHFSNLCAGKVVPDELYKTCNRWNNDFARGRELVKFFRKANDKQVRLFSQLGYFLQRANEFFVAGKEHSDEALMSLLAVCGCSRFIHAAKISDMPYKSTEGLRDIRSPLAHQPQFYHKQAVVYAIIAPVFATIMDRIADCEGDAKKLGLDVNVASYKAHEKPTDESESPRILKRI